MFDPGEDELLALRLGDRRVHADAEESGSEVGAGVRGAGQLDGGDGDGSGLDEVGLDRAESGEVALWLIARLEYVALGVAERNAVRRFGVGRHRCLALHALLRGLGR